MATSPNFNWPEPDNTDLVKNGALAIRTAVNAIDSSLVDLKGGTTGQILAKTSNTDMDFTWVANDVGDITGVTASSPLTGGGTSGAITVGIQDATTSVKGAVQLSDSTSTTSSILAATPTAVKAAYDLAVIGSTTNNNLTMVQQYTATESVLKNIPSRVPVAEQLLKQAVYWIDAAQSDNSDQVLDNQGWGAPSLTTTLGSSASADSNDPKFLDFDGTNYAYLPGVVANFFSTPDAAALDITGDLDLRVKVALDDWTPSAVNCLLSKEQTTSTRSYRLSVTTTGELILTWSPDGSATISKQSTAATGVTDGSVKWVRATLDVDNGAVGNDVKFFLSDDGITWTQLGATVTTALTTSIYSGTSQVEIGSRIAGQTEPSSGKFYRAQILNGIDGTKVLDVDTSIIGSGSATSFNALTGQTVTINRASTGKKTAVVTHPVWLFGTDDYMEVADNDLLDFGATDPFTVIAITRLWNNQTAAVAGKATDNTATMSGYLQWLNGGAVSFRAGDGTTRVGGVTSGAITLGSLTALSFVRSISADNFTSYTNATAGTPSTDTTTGTLANAIQFRIGQTATAAGQGGITYIDMEFVAAAVFRRVLTTDEITTITNYYNARVGG